MTAPSVPHRLEHIDASEAQARLDALPGSTNNEFMADLWSFRTRKGRDLAVNFSAISALLQEYPDWIINRRVDLVLLSKIVWLSLAESTTEQSYVTRFLGLNLFWAALARHNITELNKENLAQVLTFLLMNRVYRGRVIKSLGIKSSVNFGATTQLVIVRRTLAHLGLNWIGREVTGSLVKKHLKTLIPELTDDTLSYRDWYAGGSYNFLTLDHGRYYVEHCLNFFEQNFALALALSQTFRAAKHIAETLGYKELTVSNLLSRILRGFSVDDLKKDAQNWGLLTIQNVHEHVLHHFSVAYRQAHYEVRLLQEPALTSIATGCGLKPSFANVDRMRVIIWEWQQRNDLAETQLLLDQCQPPVHWQAFIREIDYWKQLCGKDLLSAPSLHDYRAIGLLEAESVRDVSKSFPRQLINSVARSGLTSVVALTGWRKSEFGFPFSAIQRIKNHDRLDEYSFPWRYQVDWHIEKTHGNVRQLREVTFNTVVTAERLKRLNGAGDDRPCLYGITQGKRNASESSLKVNIAVRALWPHYIKHYPGFKLLDDWNAWQKLARVEASGALLTAVQRREQEKLLKVRSASEWHNLKIDSNLKESGRRAREEWPRVEFFFEHGNSKGKKDWLVHYRNRTLGPKWITMLDAHLSDETKEFLLSITDDECRTMLISRAVNAELLADALYPSPHAFRHMWAEAVYRRFDGDAGWMIRSQFKHISRSMWLAYIRDKDNRFGHQRTKIRVINSLVGNYLKNKGEGYTGQLHTWLRRLFRKTAVLSPEEQIEFATRLTATEIEDVKANPWGYCLLKRRTRSKANCAEMGEPQRHNASPDLCLGCIHNLMQSVNVEWVLLHLQSHVAALQNNIVPPVFKASSYELVKNATRHIRTLNPRHEALEELDEVLESYRLTRII